MSRQRLQAGVGVVLFALVLVVSTANAAQPECRVENLPPKKASYDSNDYADPLGTAIALAAPGDTLQVVGTCRGNYVITKDLTITGRSSDQHADTIDGGLNGMVLNLPFTATGVHLTVTNLTITNGTFNVPIVEPLPPA